MIYILSTKGPDDIHRMIFDTLAEAEKVLIDLKEYWEHLHEVNKVPMREFSIKAFVEVDV